MLDQLLVVFIAAYSTFIGIATLFADHIYIRGAGVSCGLIAALLTLFSLPRKSLSWGSIFFLVFGVGAMVAPVVVGLIMGPEYRSQNALLKASAYVLTVIICAMLAANPPRLIRDSSLLISVAFAAVIALMLVFGKTTSHGRMAGFDGDTQPNYVGLIAYMSAILGLLLPSPWRYLNFAMNAYLLIAASSRNGMLATLVAGVVAMIHWQWSTGRFWRISRNAALTAGVLVLAALAVSPYYWQRAVDYVTNDLFLVTDKYRGMGSGASGRGAIWRELHRAWLSSPIWGRGYDFGATLGAATDGGYILTLAETGILGLAGVLLCFLTAVKRLAFPRHLGSTTPSVMLAYLAGFLFINIFDSRLQAAANPLSIHSYIIAFAAIAHRDAFANIDHWESGLRQTGN